MVIIDRMGVNEIKRRLKLILDGIKIHFARDGPLPWFSKVRHEVLTREIRKN